MGTLTIMITSIVGVLLAAFAGQLASEFRDWTPRWANWLIERAVRRLPGHLQERMAEEWREFVFEAPGHIVKLRRAVGLNRAARRVTSDLSDKVALTFWAHAATRAIGLIFLVFMAPILGLMVIAFLQRGGPIFERSPTTNFYRFKVGDEDGISRIVRRANLTDLPGLLNIAKGDVTFSWQEMKTFVSEVLSFFRSR